MNINASELLDVTFRSFISLVTLFLITKMLGKKQVSQLSLFDYVIGISIGNFAAEMTINLESNYINGVLAVVIFGLVALLVSILTMKSIVLRRYFMGVPTILIQHGKLLRKNMEKVKFDINDLLQECRGMGYFDIDEIEYAIMEANGKLSILPSSDYKPVIRKDLKIKKEPSVICANIVIDGKIMNENLKVMKKDKKWLLTRLEKENKKLEEILLATLDEHDKLVIYMNNRDIQPIDVLE